MEGYQNSELCKECGGKCCKLFPGAYFPGDYGFEEITCQRMAPISKNDCKGNRYILQ